MIQWRSSVLLLCIKLKTQLFLVCWLDDTIIGMMALPCWTPDRAAHETRVSDVVRLLFWVTKQCTSLAAALEQTTDLSALGLFDTSTEAVCEQHEGHKRNQLPSYRILTESSRSWA